MVAIDGLSEETAFQLRPPWCERVRRVKHWARGSRQNHGQLQRPWGERDLVSSGTRKKASEAGSKSAGGISKDVLEIQPWARCSKGFRSGKDFGFDSV